MKLFVLAVAFMLALPAGAAQITIDVPDEVVASVGEVCAQVAADVGTPSVTNKQCAEVLMRRAILSIISNIRQKEAAADTEALWPPVVGQ